MTKIDNLANEIESILSNYGESATDVVRETVDDVLKEGVKEIKSSSPRRTGEYSKGWKKETEDSRLGATGVIYNADKPQLTHLLENGHANRDGSRTPGKPHISLVNENVQAEYIRELTNRLENVT